MRFKIPYFGGYYDLIEIGRVGHIPVPLLFPLWRFLPIPLGRYRTEDFFKCPTCTRTSFFQFPRVCDICFADLLNFWDDLKAGRYVDGLTLWYVYSMEKYRERIIWNKKREILKKVANIFLPVLLMLGIVKYNIAMRHCYRVDSFIETLKAAGTSEEQLIQALQEGRVTLEDQSEIVWWIKQFG